MMHPTGGEGVQGYILFVGRPMIRPCPVFCPARTSHDTSKSDGGRTMCKIFGKLVPVSDLQENTAITNAATFSGIGVNIFLFAGEQIEMPHRLKQESPRGSEGTPPRLRRGDGKHRGNVHPAHLQGQCPCPPCRQGRKGARTTQDKHHLHIELTWEQYELLCRQAKACGLTKRAFLARLIEGQPVRARPSREIRELRTEIHRIGNNINQIARSVHMGIARPEDARRSLFLLEQVYGLLSELERS